MRVTYLDSGAVVLSPDSTTMLPTSIPTSPGSHPPPGVLVGVPGLSSATFVGSPTKTEITSTMTSSPIISTVSGGYTPKTGVAGVLDKEPILAVGTIVNLVQAGLALGLAFGLPLDKAQQDAIVAFVSILFVTVETLLLALRGMVYSPATHEQAVANAAGASAALAVPVTPAPAVNPSV